MAYVIRMVDQVLVATSKLHVNDVAILQNDLLQATQRILLPGQVSG